MKKYLSLLEIACYAIFGIAAILMVGCLTACSFGTKTDVQTKDTLSIVTTIFPEYDWVQNILGENKAEAEVTMLLDNGVDLHS